jgi:hypothetical protein
MLRGECESAGDIDRVSPGFCMRNVGWRGFVRGQGDEEVKWSFYAQGVGSHAPTGLHGHANARLLIHWLPHQERGTVGEANPRSTICRNGFGY